MRVERTESRHFERVSICGDTPWKCDVTTDVSLVGGDPIVVLYVGRDEKRGRGTSTAVIHLTPSWRQQVEQEVYKIFLALRQLHAPIEKGDEEAIEAAVERALPRAVQDWITSCARGLVDFLDSAGAAEAWAMAEAELVLES